MSNLTMHMIRDAMAKVGEPPPRQEIKCGDIDEFVAAIDRKTGQTVLRMSKSYAVYAGIEVKVSPHVPIDKAVVIEGGEIKSIINLREAGE